MLRLERRSESKNILMEFEIFRPDKMYDSSGRLTAKKWMLIIVMLLILLLLEPQQYTDDPWMSKGISDWFIMTPYLVRVIKK